MKLIPVVVEGDRNAIQPSSWPKKKLADHHIELLKLCGFDCVYCSSNAGMHLKMRMQSLTQQVEKVTGQPFNSFDAGHLVLIKEKTLETLEQELQQHSQNWGAGKTLVVSQLTDSFSGPLVKDGTIRKMLEMILEQTSFRIRILTKNAIVGQREWIRFFDENRERIVVGLSIGTLDDEWAKNVERLTSTPSARLKAMRALQDARIPTFGMLCPVFPHALAGDQLEQLVDAIRPEQCEHVWAEPYNDRQNWQQVQNRLARDSQEWQWFQQVYGQSTLEMWSEYASELYERLHRKSALGEWTDKLRYLLYEQDIIASDVPRFRNLDGVLLQSKCDESGRSKNPGFAKIQQRLSE